MNVWAYGVTYMLMFTTGCLQEAADMGWVRSTHTGIVRAQAPEGNALLELRGRISPRHLIICIKPGLPHCGGHAPTSSYAARVPRTPRATSATMEDAASTRSSSLSKPPCELICVSYLLAPHGFFNDDGALPFVTLALVLAVV